MLTRCPAHLYGQAGENQEQIGPPAPSTYFKAGQPGYEVEGRRTRVHLDCECRDQ